MSSEQMKETGFFLNSTRILFYRPSDGALRSFPHFLRAWITRVRIPIFIKLATTSILLIALVISSISFSMLNKQKKQFIDQLIDLGEGMTRIAANNAPDKLLGEEDLALFKLVNDIAQNDQILYALVTDDQNNIRAHSQIEKMINKPYDLPKKVTFLKKNGDLTVRSSVHEGEEILFFEKPITYQKLRVGKVYLAISKEKILENMASAKFFLLLRTLLIIFLGILLSLGLGIYISRPINKLRESTKALGRGEFDHRVLIQRNDELGDLGLAFNKMAEDLALKEKIQDSFGRYVNPEIVEMILENPDTPWMKGSKVVATVLFVDIRGFTALSEDKEPEWIIEMLNDYFSFVTDVVFKHGGHIDKFVGDEAMAVFGTPVPNHKHAEAAVRAALDIKKGVADFDRETKWRKADLQVGMGVNSGEMVSGNLGSQKRMEYTVIGDNVNVASRLTSLAKPGEILISRQTLEMIEDAGSFNFEERGTVPVKGRKTEITIFNVLDCKGGPYGMVKQTAV